MQISNYYNVKTVLLRVVCVFIKIHIALHVILVSFIGITHASNHAQMDIMLLQANVLHVHTHVKLVYHLRQNVYHASMAIYFNQLVLYLAHHHILRIILILSANHVSLVAHNVMHHQPTVFLVRNHITFLMMNVFCNAQRNITIQLLITIFLCVVNAHHLV